MSSFPDGPEPVVVDDDQLRQFFEISDELNGFLMLYSFGLEEMLTKINILKQELTHANSSTCPIEHVSHRLKRPSSIAEKARRLGCGPSFDDVRASRVGHRRHPGGVQLRQ